MPSAQQCVICYDELTDGLSAAPCGHVFHSICIDQWNGPGQFCPICHVRLPPQLLKLYYEPQKDSPDDPATGTCSSVSACAIVTGSPTAASGTGETELVPAEVTQLRRQLASSQKVLQAGKENHIKQGKELQDMKRQFIAAEAAAMKSQAELEAAAAANSERIEAYQIELFKKNRDNNKLKREMEAASKRLRDSQGEKVAYSYLSQFASPSRGRALTGLGQVDVEKVLDQIRHGNARAETVIRGQHEQLTGSIDREQKAKRELRKTKLESETMSLELQQVRSRLTKAKKETYRLEKTLAKTTSTATTSSDGQVPRGRGGGTPTSPSAGALLGDWVAEERPCKNGGESTWALSRRSVNGGGALGGSKEQKRSAPVGGGSGARAATTAGPTGLKSAKRRRTEKEEGKEEGDEDLVSLGSDDDGDDDSDAGDNSAAHARDGDARGRKQSGARWHNALNVSTLMNPIAPSRSFLTSAAAKAGGGGTGALRNLKPAKFINKGHNAVGGRHQVRLSSSSSFSASSQNPFCLEGKDSRHAAASSSRLH